MQRVRFITIAIIFALTGCSTAPAAALPTAAPVIPAPGATVAAPTGAVPLGTSGANTPYAAADIVVAYYAELAQQRYQQAYALWDGDGAASGQDVQTFTSGFANTAQTRLFAGEPQQNGVQVTLPVTITSVVNLSGGAQEVQQYNGTYTLNNTAQGWKIGAASISQTATNPPVPAELAEPQAAMAAYYRAINAKQYARAFSFWANSGAGLGQLLSAFAAGYASTASVALAQGTPQTEGAAGSAYSTVPVGIRAASSAGDGQSFCGGYVLRRSNVPPFDGYGWQIERGRIAPSDAASAEDALTQCGAQ